MICINTSSLPNLQLWFAIHYYSFTNGCLLLNRISEVSLCSWFRIVCPSHPWAGVCRKWSCFYLPLFLFILRSSVRKSLHQLLLRWRALLVSKRNADGRRRITKHAFIPIQTKCSQLPTGQDALAKNCKNENWTAGKTKISLSFCKKNTNPKSIWTLPRLHE